MRKLGIETMRKISQELKDAMQSGKTKEKIAKIDADFNNGLLQIGTEYEGVAWAFLKGESIYASQMKKIEVSTKITTDEKAGYMLIEFLKLLKILGYRALIVLIDEFEYIFTATGTKRSAQLIVTFKDLYDKVNEMIQLGQDTTKPIFIIACTPGSWNEGIPSLMEKVGLGGIRPFWERIHKAYPIEPFNVEETRALIISRLEKRRIREDATDALFPFKEDYIKKINDICEGVPRRILKRTAFVLGIADQREISEIGSKEAEKILREYKYT